MGNSFNLLQWHQPTEEKEVNSERFQAKPELKDTLPRLSRKPSLVSPSQPSEDLPEEVESRESALSSMTRPELSSDTSLRMSSETQSPTLSTPRERPSPLSTLSTLSRDKEEPSTVSEADLFRYV